MASAAVCLLLVLSLLSSASAESPLMQQLAAARFSGFAKLLEQADLIPEVEASLKAGNGLTVFVPTDDALLYHTSPTLLAFLKLKENKAALKKVLLSHFIAERVSPFDWQGAHTTLEGSPLALTIDSQAFYAQGVAVSQYNALVTPDASVHAIPSLIIPSDVAGSAQTFVEEGTDVRRVLVAADAPAAADITTTPGMDKPVVQQPATTAGTTTATPNAAAASFISSVSVIVLSFTASLVL